MNSACHRQVYSHEFIQYQLDLLKRHCLACLSSSTFLIEILRQLVPTSDVILSLNSVRQSLVENWIHQFRKDTHKLKWIGNSDKIQALVVLIERSVKLFDTSEPTIENIGSSWYAIVFQLFESTINELNENLTNKLDKHEQQAHHIAHVIKPLGQLCEQWHRIDEKRVRTVTDDYNELIDESY
jgi:uncharacterized coiled-coil protein SlyX